MQRLIGFVRKLKWYERFRNNEKAQKILWYLEGVLEKYKKMLHIEISLEIWIKQVWPKHYVLDATLPKTYDKVWLVYKDGRVIKWLNKMENNRYIVILWLNNVSVKDVALIWVKWKIITCYPLSANISIAGEVNWLYVLTKDTVFGSIIKWVTNFYNEFVKKSLITVNQIKDTKHWDEMKKLKKMMIGWDKVIKSMILINVDWEKYKKWWILFIDLVPDTWMMNYLLTQSFPLS